MLPINASTFLSNKDLSGDDTFDSLEKQFLKGLHLLSSSVFNIYRIVDSTKIRERINFKKSTGKTWFWKKKVFLLKLFETGLTTNEMQNHHLLQLFLYILGSIYTIIDSNVQTSNKKLTKWNCWIEIQLGQTAWSWRRQ